MIVTSFQNLKFLGKKIYQHFLIFIINNALSYQFLVSVLTQNKKMTEKSVFCKASSPKLMPQSFPVSCFWPHGLIRTPPEVKFCAFGTSKHRAGKSLSKNFFCYIYQYIGEILLSK